MTGGNGSSTAIEINVTSTPPKVIATLPLVTSTGGTASWAPIDFTLASGFMWGLSATTVYRMSLSTGVVSTFPAPSGVKSGNFGAAWTFSNGNLGFSNNQTGDIYQLSITNPSTTPGFTIVSNYTGPVAGSSNDGAACVAPNVDLGITKTGTTTVAPGGTVTWTMTVTNFGPGNSSGFAVNDVVPTGVTNVTSSTPGCKVTGNTVLCSEGVLANGGTFTITVVGTAPTTNGTCFTNSATVTGNELDPNSANNTASAAQTCTTPAVTLVKSANVTGVSAPGTVVTYSYLVTNTSTSASSTLTGLTVTDPMTGLSAINCGGVTTLAPLASVTCTATYTTTQADINKGSISNTGTAKGTANGSSLTATSSVTIPVTQTPKIAIVKSASIGGYSAPGTPITYTYKLTNSGNVTLTSVKVTDPMAGLSTINCGGVTTLAPAASVSCTATYTTTQADVDNGNITNTGTATGTPPTGPAVTAASSVVIPGTQTPGITLKKTSTASGFSASGTVVTYHYLVTNSGNVTLTSVGVTDPLPGLSAVSCPNSSLAPGAAQTCTATYTTTQADVDKGSITNTATASGMAPSGSTVTSPPSSVTIPATVTPKITLVKTSDIPSFSGISAPGVVVTYSYAVTNSGNVTLTSVNVTDPMPGLSSVNCTSPTLAPGASETCTATYTTTQADVDRGSIVNTGTATGTAPSGSKVTATSSVTIRSIQNPAIGLNKTANVSSISAPGTLITYSYNVTNSGNSTLTSVKVTDPMPGLSAISCPSSTLAPGVSETCTATYTTTQADVNAGAIHNTGTATGTPPTGANVTDTSSVTIPTTRSPAILLIKTANVGSFSAAGVPITYSYKVTNTGNVTLTSVKVTDPMPGLSTINCGGVTTLLPGASATCTATYTTTQTDLDNGDISNTGTASGTPPSGPPVTDSASLDVPAGQTPGISLNKTANVPSFTAPGRVVTYSYVVTNTGNVTLSPVTVTDPMPGLSAINCFGVTTLAPRASVTCTATYTTTQTDVDNGSLSNTGSATGTPPSGSPVADTSSVTIPAIQTPTIRLAKSPSISSFSAAGTLITYSYLVTNTGNVTLSPVTVTDPMPGLSAVNCGTAPVTLAPSASVTCTATYTTAQADVDAGGISNIGTASGTPPTGPPVTNSKPATVTATQTPAILLAKSASINSFSAAGTPITFSYAVTNTGNVTLTSVTVTDPLAGLSAVNCGTPPVTLAPGDSVTCTATYTTTQADVDAGGVVNTGTASGTPPSGPVVKNSATLATPAVQTPAIGLQKTSSVTSFSSAGTLITYTYLVLNSGNATLNNVSLSDDVLGTVNCGTPPVTLSVGASVTCTATYTTTQADVDNGGVTNTAVVKGMTAGGQPVTDTTTLTVPADQTPGIQLMKTADTPNFSAPGTVITYRYLVTNTGNLTLNPVTVTDPLPGLSAIFCPRSLLAPGLFETCSATYTTTQADVDNGGVTNTATVTGVTPDGQTVTDGSTVTVPSEDKPAIAVHKSADATSFSAAGVTINYSYLVSNVGNQTLTGVTVTDPQPNLSAVSCPEPSLAPGDSETCTASYITTQADVDAGGITNIGTASGTDTNGDNVTDTSTLVLPADQTPAISLVKTPDAPDFSAPGQEITYDYLVTNTGNVTLDNVTVTDPMSGLSPVSCSIATLAPGDQETCTANYVTTQLDVDRGNITNTGTATGTPPSGPAVTSTSTATLPAVQNPSIELAKTSSPSSYTAAGTVITYSYEITNSSNVTLHAVTVNDPLPGLSVIACPLTTLAPLASETCAATYTTTQADVDRGDIVNVAVASGTSPLGVGVTDQASLTVPALAGPEIELLKSANVNSFSAANTVITYSYKVTNTGNQTLTSVAVTDPMTGLSPINCGTPPVTLAPNASVTCTATYTTRVADVDAGGITNTGTASGTPPTGPPVTDQSSLTIPAVTQPAISLVKSANIQNFSAAGTPVTYSYLITNTGNQTLTSVTVTDPMTGLSAINCQGITTLAPGASVTCTATYTTTQADVDNGGITNTGTASGIPPSGPPAVTDQSTLTLPALQTPGLTLAKSALPVSFSAVGTLITYSYAVSNDGNVTLNPVVVTDPMTGLSAINCGGVTTLAPGASVTCTATYTTTQSDVDRGQVANTGTVTGTAPSGAVLVRQSSAVVVAPKHPPSSL